MSSKARVQTRLKQAVKASQSKNKCSDLKTAKRNFEVMKQRLKLLTEALKAHHKSLVQMHKTRMDAVGLVATLSLNTPMFECAGQISCEGDDALSYASVHSSMGAQQKMFLDKYVQYVVNYTVEWERVLTERISAGLKKSEAMRIELDHYQEKIKPIRIAYNVAVAKEKKVDPKLVDKFHRNEEKFTSAKVSYEKFVHALAVLIDEATLRSWKDLHPLILKMTQYDVTVARTEAKSLGGLDQVVSKLKNFSQDYGLKDSRLRDFQSMDAFELSGIDEEEYLALNASYVTNKYIKDEKAAQEAFDSSLESMDYLTSDGKSSALAITQNPASFSSDSKNSGGLVVQQQNGNGSFGSFDYGRRASSTDNGSGSGGGSNSNNNNNNSLIDTLAFTVPKNYNDGGFEKPTSSSPPSMDFINDATSNLTLSTTINTAAPPPAPSNAPPSPPSVVDPFSDGSGTNNNVGFVQNSVSYGGDLTKQMQETGPQMSFRRSDSSSVGVGGVGGFDPFSNNHQNQPVVNSVHSNNNISNNSNGGSSSSNNNNNNSGGLLLNMNNSNQNALSQQPKMSNNNPMIGDQSSNANSNQQLALTNTQNQQLALAQHQNQQLTLAQHQNQQMMALAQQQQQLTFANNNNHNHNQKLQQQLTIGAHQNPQMQLMQQQMMNSMNQQQQQHINPNQLVAPLGQQQHGLVNPFQNAQ